jgi:hypothetical protein
MHKRYWIKSIIKNKFKLEQSVDHWDSRRIVTNIRNYYERDVINIQVHGSPKGREHEVIVISTAGPQYI